jgi:trigger factor
MKVDVIEVGSFQRKLQFVVPAETVRSELDQAYRLLGQRARLKGFRPGKAPKSVLEAQFGDRVQSDVANQLVQVAWRDAMSAHNLKPVSRPALEASEPVRSGSAFQFTITVEVRPELKLASYTGVEVAYPRVDVTDDEVSAAVRQRLEGSARLVDVTDRAVQAGDLVMAELTVKDGKEVVAQELGTMLRTDADPYYPGVESLLLGLSIGGKAKGEVSFAETARTESVRGRTLKVAIEVKGIQANQVPELSDALAQELGFDGGADGMRAALRMQIQERREELARNQARANLLEALIAANPFAVPGAMVDESLQMLMEELKLQQAWRTGRDPKTITFSEAQVRDLRARAEFAAKASLILEFVSKTESLGVTEAELEAKYQELADTRGQSLEAVKGYFLRDGAVDELKDRMLEEKTLDWLLERATLTTPDAPAAVPAGALADVAASLVDKAVSEKKKVSEAKKKRGEEAAPEAPAAEAAPAEEKPKKKAAAKKKDEAEAAPAVEAAADDKPKKKAAKKKSDEG